MSVIELLFVSSGQVVLTFLLHCSEKDTFAVFSTRFMAHRGCAWDEWPCRHHRRIIHVLFVLFCHFCASRLSRAFRLTIPVQHMLSRTLSIATAVSSNTWAWSVSSTPRSNANHPHTHTHTHTETEAFFFVSWLCLTTATHRLRANGGAPRPDGARRVDGHLARRHLSAGRAGRSEAHPALRGAAAFQAGLRRHPRQGSTHHHMYKSAHARRAGALSSALSLACSFFFFFTNCLLCCSYFPEFFISYHV